ncbi:hypothetical protein [Acinetobacter lwoffii]|uniref:hypothetical protein n=1 Tax=Acinetobacter lwoffii TaxID=28090 RepID=UPI003F8D1C93
MFEAGAKIIVNFDNEGSSFKGYAVVDRSVDGRVYGTMLDGRTFMCEFCFVVAIDSKDEDAFNRFNDSVLHGAYQDWVKAQDFYPTLLANRGTALFLRDGDEYRYMPVRVGFKAYQMIQNNRGTI